MNKKKYGWIAIALVAFVVLFFVMAYNSFVKLDLNVNNKWGEVQNTYQRRADLVPNVVNIVKGSTEFEKSTLTQLAEARARAGQMRTDSVTYETYQAQEAAQANLTNQLNKTIALVESYPNLQSTNEFKTLQGQLEGTERRIKFARQDFNTAVMEYNQKARRFPWNIAGGLLGFKPKNGFTSDPGAGKSPEVQFK